MRVYLTKDSDNLFQAVVVDDATLNEQDAVRLYYDVNLNLGDPDEEDRLIEVFRNGVLNVYHGRGSNVDSLAWEPLATDTVVVEVGEPSNTQWALEMAIDTDSGLLDDGLMSPSNPHGMMAEFLFEGDSVAWPPGANIADAGTWSPIDNPSCG